MDKPIGTYSFLPYLRIGLANKIQQPDQDPVKLRASFRLHLTVEGTPVNGGMALKEVIDKEVQLYGPGDLEGIESRAIFKTEPLNWITNFEPNYLPYIDFYDEDYAWRYTPNRPDDMLRRLRPWLALVVLERDEFVDCQDSKDPHYNECEKRNDKSLPKIRVENAVAKFPPPEQLWAWAHVHVNKDLAANDGEMVSTDMNVVLPKLANVLRENKDHAYCRILCPRKLKPNVAYHAFLIPSFEGGRQAGLGVTDVKPDFASQYAWGQKPDQVEFPYYHRWYFRTGTVGDFEYLVRLLKAKPADERVGRRDMDVQKPGWNIPGLDPDGELGGILKLGGALRVPKEVIKDINEFNKYEHWSDNGYPQPIQQGIAKFLNAADDYQKTGSNPKIIYDPENVIDPDPLITPPLYGRWHAAVDRLLTDADGNPFSNNKNWIHELNLDPRFRVPAGFGTKIIQDKQEDYMNAAWQQVGDVLKANRFIRFAQFSSETMWQWHTLQFQPLVVQQPDKLMLLSAPVQKRVMVENATVFHQIKTSVVPQVAVSAQMRKIMRPRSRIVRKLPFEEQGITPSTLFSRLNAQEIHAAPPKVKPAGIQTEQVLAEQIQPPPKPKWLADLLRQYPWLATATLGLAILLVLLAVLLTPAVALSALLLGLAGGLIFIYRLMHNILKQLSEPQIFTDQGQTPESVDVAPTSPDFRISDPDDTFQPGVGSSDNPVALNFKIALKDMYKVDIAARQAAFEPPKQVLDLPLIAGTLAANLHPYRTVPRLVLDRVLLPDRFSLPIRFTPKPTRGSMSAIWTCDG